MTAEGGGQLTVGDAQRFAGDGDDEHLVAAVHVGDGLAAVRTSDAGCGGDGVGAGEPVGTCDGDRGRGDLADLAALQVNGALAFLTYFSASDIFRSVPSGHLIFSKLPSIVHYGSFVLLDAALVTLFCKQQDLYWTPRTRSFAEESAGVVKAVSYATLLLDVAARCGVGLPRYAEENRRVHRLRSKMAE